MDSKELFKAAFEGDLETVRAAIESGTDPNVVAGNGMSLLLCTIWQNGNPHVVEFLLENGADGTYRQPSNGWNGLVYAAVNGHAEVLRILLDRGFAYDAEAGDWKGLMFAVTYRNAQTAEMLLRAGADPDIRDDDGRTPLMRAAGNSDVAAVEMLLRYHPNINAQDTQGMTALMYAARKAKVENVRQLLDAGADRTIRNSAGESALDFAVEKKRTKMIPMLRITTDT